MKSVFKFAFIAGLTFLVAAEVAYGQAQSYGTNDPGVQQRMQNQQQRIDQGISSGQLTPREAGRLEAQEARIKQDELRMKSDGNLTPAERQRSQPGARQIQRRYLPSEARCADGQCRPGRRRGQCQRPQHPAAHAEPGAADPAGRQQRRAHAQRGREARGAGSEDQAGRSAR